MKILFLGDKVKSHFKCCSINHYTFMLQDKVFAYSPWTFKVVVAIAAIAAIAVVVAVVAIEAIAIVEVIEAVEGIKTRGLLRRACMSEMRWYLLGLLMKHALFDFSSLHTRISIAAHHLPNNGYVCSYHQKRINQAGLRCLFTALFLSSAQKAECQSG